MLVRAIPQDSHFQNWRRQNVVSCSEALAHREGKDGLSWPACGLRCCGRHGAIRLEANDTLRADHVSGNSMHFSSIGVIQLVALACFQKLP